MRWPRDRHRGQRASGGTAPKAKKRPLHVDKREQRAGGQLPSGRGGIVRSPRTRTQVSTWTCGETNPWGIRGSLEAPFATSPGTGTGPAASRPSSDTNEGKVPEPSWARRAGSGTRNPPPAPSPAPLARCRSRCSLPRCDPRAGDGRPSVDSTRKSSCPAGQGDPEGHEPQNEGDEDQDEHSEKQPWPPPVFRNTIVDDNGRGRLAHRLEPTAACRRPRQPRRAGRAAQNDGADPSIGRAPCWRSGGTGVAAGWAPPGADAGRSLTGRPHRAA